MKIDLLGINYWPEETGIGPFNGGRAEYLAARGHDVRAFTGFPYYPAWRIPAEYRGRLFADEQVRGVAVRRCYLYAPAKPRPLTRVLHEASFVASSLVRALASRPADLLLVVSPPLGLGAAAIALKKLKGVPFVCHVEDLQPDAAVDLGMLRAGAAANALYALERRVYREAWMVTTLTEEMRARIIAKGVPAEKVALWPGWPDPPLFDIPAGVSADARRAHGLTTKHVVLHVGNMGVKQGLDVVVRAAALTQHDPDIGYVFAGDGAMRERLQLLASELRLRNLRFLPLQPRDAFRTLLAAADAALITQQRTVNDVVFPSKAMTLLAAARPIAAAVDERSRVAAILRRSGAGSVAPPEDPRALTDAVGRLIRRPDVAELGRAGRAFAREHWDRDTLLSRMERMLTAYPALPPAQHAANFAGTWR